MSSSFLGGPFGSPGAPGFVPPTATAGIGQGAATSEAAMANRYNQLGMGGSTPEAMDLGILPSITGGIPGQFGAVAGQLQNQALQTSPIGSSQSPASLIGGAGRLLGNFK
jgi:hypothetical protein